MKIPKGYSEDTKGLLRRYQRVTQKLPKGYSELIDEGHETYKGKRTKRHLMVDKTLHCKLKTQQEQ